MRAQDGIIHVRDCHKCGAEQPPQMLAGRAARYLGVTKATLSEWRNVGWVKDANRLLTSYTYYRSDLDACVEDRAKFLGIGREKEGVRYATVR